MKIQKGRVIWTETRKLLEVETCNRHKHILRGILNIIIVQSLVT